jgi:hypothetical protein
MLAHRPAILAKLDPIGIGTDPDRSANRARGDGILVVVEPHQAGLGD